MPDTHVRANPLIVTALFLSILTAGWAWFSWQDNFAFGVYGVLVSVIMGTKVALSLTPAPTWPRRAQGVRNLSVGAIVPFYNEDPALLEANLNSIARQSRPVQHLIVVDDGSPNRDAYNMAVRWAADHSNTTVLRQPNGGKRVAMGHAFRAVTDDVDVWLCVDSDTVLDRRAVREGLAPFIDPKVTAVTGLVIALNARSGLLPFLIDLRYMNAFLYERGAYSRLGSVLCVCGSLAFWRGDIITKHLDDFLSQRFLGQGCTYGDDRHLTNLSLLNGQVVLAPRAVARTAVPERVGHLVKQQIRWGKSFFRESLWALRRQSAARPAFWLTLVELVSWVGFTSGLFLTVLILPLVTGRFYWQDYLVWTMLAGYARSVHVFSVRRPDLSRTRQCLQFALAPVYGALHITLLMPLRLYSLLTLSNGTWGTRGQGVEVAIGQPSHPRHTEVAFLRPASVQTPLVRI